MGWLHDGIVKIDMKIDLSYSAAEITHIQMTSQVDNQDGVLYKSTGTTWSMIRALSVIKSSPTIHSGRYEGISAQ